MLSIGKINVLRRVTGGAKGRGEQNKSFNTDEPYIPSPRTATNLSVLSNDSSRTLCGEKIHPRPISGYPKKNIVGKIAMKNV